MLRSSVIRSFLFAVVVVGLLRLVAFPGPSEAASAVVPPPAMDAPLASAHGEQMVVFSGGCFWGVQAVFQHVKGVISATSGYAGGDARSADYETVSGGRTGHAESVKVVFDPAQVTCGTLLQVFFSVAHDPTELNRQGPDEGTQYRSMISYTTDEQQKITEAYITQLESAHVFKHKIVTQVVALKGFYPAEAYHQNYATLHPNSPYIRYNDAPKVDNLKREFGNLYRESPQLVAVK
jgi:peptide-methionine (S)-S-oxide reductase